jgi:multidrug resistance efflux pump
VFAVVDLKQLPRNLARIQIRLKVAGSVTRRKIATGFMACTVS